MDIFKYLLCTMHNLVVKVRHGELGPLNWTCCSNLQWHWPYNVCISVESSIKKLLWYLSTMQRNYKLVWMLNFTQKKHYLSKSLTIVSFLHLVPWLIDAKYKPLNYAFASTILPQSKVLLEASPARGSRKSAWFWKTDEKRTQWDGKRTQGNTLWGCVHWHCPSHCLGARILTKLIKQPRILRKVLTGKAHRQTTSWKDDLTKGKQPMCGTESKGGYSFIHKSACCMNRKSNTINNLDTLLYSLQSPFTHTIAFDSY